MGRQPFLLWLPLLLLAFLAFHSYAEDNIFQGPESPPVHLGNAHVHEAQDIHVEPQPKSPDPPPPHPPHSGSPTDTTPPAPVAPKVAESVSTCSNSDVLAGSNVGVQDGGKCTVFEQYQQAKPGEAIQLQHQHQPLRLPPPPTHTERPKRTPTVIPSPDEFERGQPENVGSTRGAEGSTLNSGAAGGLGNGGSAKGSSNGGSQHAHHLAGSLHLPHTAHLHPYPHGAGGQDDASKGGFGGVKVHVEHGGGGEDDDEHRMNLADADDGASIVAANKEARKPEKAIDGDDDSYMKNSCSAQKWIIIELSQLGRIEELEIVNKEMYSSRLKEFSVRGRQLHPRKDSSVPDYPSWFETDHWPLLGEFTAANRKGSQTFKIPLKQRIRYLLVQFHSHYGSEEVCALNSIRALGVSAAQELEDALAWHLHPSQVPSSLGASEELLSSIPQQDPNSHTQPTQPSPQQHTHHAHGSAGPHMSEGDGVSGGERKADHPASQQLLHHTQGSTGLNTEAEGGNYVGDKWEARKGEGNGGDSGEWQGAKFGEVGGVKADQGKSEKSSGQGPAPEGVDGGSNSPGGQVGSPRGVSSVSSSMNSNGDSGTKTGEGGSGSGTEEDDSAHGQGGPSGGGLQGHGPGAAEHVNQQEPQQEGRDEGGGVQHGFEMGPHDATVQEGANSSHSKDGVQGGLDEGVKGGSTGSNVQHVDSKAEGDGQGTGTGFSQPGDTVGLSQQHRSSRDHQGGSSPPCQGGIESGREARQEGMLGISEQELAVHHKGDNSEGSDMRGKQSSSGSSQEVCAGQQGGHRQQEGPLKTAHSQDPEQPNNGGQVGQPDSLQQPHMASSKGCSGGGVPQSAAGRHHQGNCPWEEGQLSSGEGCLASFPDCRQQPGAAQAAGDRQAGGGASNDEPAAGRDKSTSTQVRGGGQQHADHVPGSEVRLIGMPNGSEPQGHKLPLMDPTAPLAQHPHAFGGNSSAPHAAAASAMEREAALAALHADHAEAASRAHLAASSTTPLDQEAAGSHLHGSAGNLGSHSPVDHREPHGDNGGHLHVLHADHPPARDVLDSTVPGFSAPPPPVSLNEEHGSQGAGGHGGSRTYGGDPPAASAASPLSSIDPFLLAMEGGGPTTKHKHASNLFDLFKQEFVLLRVNQTRIWKYINSLVDVLNKNAAEADEEVQRLEGILAEMRLEVSQVPAQIKDQGRQLDARYAPQLAQVLQEVAELRAQVRAGRARERGLLLYGLLAMLLLVAGLLRRQSVPTSPSLYFAPAMVFASILIGVLLHAPSLQDLVGVAARQLARYRGYF